MSFHLLPINYSTDLPRLAEIERDAYKSAPDSIHEILFPPSPSSNPEADKAARLGVAIKSLGKHEGREQTKFVKVMLREDQDTKRSGEGEGSAMSDGGNKEGKETIIAFARWSFYTPDNVDKITHLTRSQVLEVYGEECNKEAVGELFGGIAEGKERIIGWGPHAQLNGLACDPAYQRRGAAQILVSYGCAEADHLGLDAYLAASQWGLPLYLRNGFKEVEVVGMDPRKYGGVKESHDTVIMRRVVGGSKEVGKGRFDIRGEEGRSRLVHPKAVVNFYYSHFSGFWESPSKSRSST